MAREMSPEIQAEAHRRGLIPKPLSDAEPKE